MLSILQALPAAAVHTAALFVTLFPQLSHADHFQCSWLEGFNSPFDYGYERLCIADVSKSLTGNADYRCAKEWGNLYGQMVAEFNILRPGRLEFTTACGGGGYAVDESMDPNCKAIDTIAVCLGRGDPHRPLHEIKCFFMARKDDCEWPTDFTNETIPDLVDIWFKPLPERRAFECDGDDYV